MIFKPNSQIKDVVLVKPNPINDDRGFFARAFCEKEFGEHGIFIDRWPQANISYNKYEATLRGLHFQHAPCQEDKLVRCVMGSIFDVAVDLRPSSPTYCQWVGYYLYGMDVKWIPLEDRNSALLIPKGFAHGYLTLQDDTEVHYQVSEYYAKEAEAGFRFDDPRFNILWPRTVKIISDRDRNHPLFTD